MPLISGINSSWSMFSDKCPGGKLSCLIKQNHLFLAKNNINNNNNKAYPTA